MKLTSTRTWLWILGVTNLVIMLVFHFWCQSLKPSGATSIVALQMSFTPQKFGDIAESWGPEGRALFVKSMALDFVFPVTYAAFLSLALWVRGFRWLILLPILAALFDCRENILHLKLMATFPVLYVPYVLKASQSAVIKYALILISLGCLPFRQRQNIQ